MLIWLAVVYGALQGLTEFIPVSSSGHLALAQHFWGSGVDHLLLEMINLGTLLALLFAFRKKLWAILQDVFLRRRWRFALNLLITAIPAGVLGLLLGDFIAGNAFFGNALVVCLAMALVGLVMIGLERILQRLKPRENNLEKLTPRQALLIGLSQTVALVPGVSRSGATIITGRLLGLKARDAAEYSFLASIPLFCGVVLKGFLSSTDRAYWGANLGPLLIGNFVACLVGVVVIKYLLAYLQRKNSLKIFGIYRVVLALSVLVILLVSSQ